MVRTVWVAVYAVITASNFLEVGTFFGCKFLNVLFEPFGGNKYWKFSSVFALQSVFLVESTFPSVLDPVMLKKTVESLTINVITSY